VEDKFAAVLVEESLPAASRSRVIIRDVGDRATLARQGVAHLKMNAQLQALNIFDGDCTQAEIEGWIKNETGGNQALQPEWLILPGAGVNPERWILDALHAPAYRTELASQLNCSNAEASGHVDAMHVQLDQHDSSFVLSGRTALEKDDCRRRMIRSVARLHPELDALRLRVGQLLGQT
jgi:hypothetical protein